MIDVTSLAHRTHPGYQTVPLHLSPEDREHLESLLRASTTEKRLWQRGQALLWMADAVPGADIARLLGIEESTVCRWRKRFAGENPLSRLADAQRSGRPPSLSRPRTARESKRKLVASPAT